MNQRVSKSKRHGPFPPFWDAQLCHSVLVEQTYPSCPNKDRFAKLRNVTLFRDNQAAIALSQSPHMSSSAQIMNPKEILVPNAMAIGKAHCLVANEPH